MKRLVILAALAVCAVSAAEDEEWTVGIEMTSSRTKLVDAVSQNWYSLPTSFVIVGTWRGVENVSLSGRIGGADAPLIQKTGGTVGADDFFPGFVLGFDGAYGREYGGGDMSWEAGVKLGGFWGRHDAGANKLSEGRFAPYFNLEGWPWDTFYFGVRLALVSATYTSPGPDAELSQTFPMGFVVGIREKAERLSYSMELGLGDSTTLSVGAGYSF